MPNLFTLQEAIDYGNNGDIEKWVHLFLLDIGDNKAFSDGLKLFKRYFTKPLLTELSILKRCCGPEDNIKYKIDKDAFENNVQRMVRSIAKGWDMPPLIVNYSKGEFELNDGNHRYEALIRSGRTQYYVIFWTTDAAEFKEIHN